MIENTLRIKEAAEFIKSKNYEKAIKILDVEFASQKVINCSGLNKIFWNLR